MKKVNDEEELYPLSGWDIAEDNLSSYSDTFIKKNQQNIQKVVNSKSPQPPHFPNRTHFRRKSKEYFQSKLSNGHLKIDKQYLQQYIKREQACLTQTDNTFFQEPSPKECIKFQAQMIDKNIGKQHRHKKTEIFISSTRSPQQQSAILEKYILFSGIHKPQSKKRRFFLKNNPKETSEKHSSKELFISSQKTLQTKIRQKVNFQKINQIDFDRQDFCATLKKILKFPLFYRQLNSNEQLQKDKYKSTIHLRQKLDVKFSEQFTDDNIFQTRFIRA